MVGALRTLVMVAVVAIAHAAVSVSEAGVLSAALLFVVVLAVGGWSLPLASLRSAFAADGTDGGASHPLRVGRDAGKVESTHPGIYSLFVIRR